MSDSNTKETATPDVVIPTQPTNEFLSTAEKAKIELAVRISCRQEYEQLFEIWKNNSLIELEKKQNEVIQKGLQAYYEEWKKEQKPPEPEDIQVLLDQEYETFTLPVDVMNIVDNTVERRTFVIRELPQAIEKKFYRQFKVNLLNKISELEALVQSEMDTTFENKVKAGLNLFDESFDVMADAVVMILNPFGNKDIDRAWVQNNICSDRQWRIIEAQMKVNRLRDFFSKVSTSSQNMMMMKRPNFQALQQLAV